MEADPQVGDMYRQENLSGVAEDIAEVLSLDETVSVAFGIFNHCLNTRDFTPLERGSRRTSSTVLMSVPS
jgi:hypothetical protein